MCLIGMLLFAITGITLNHASQIEARPNITVLEAELPDALRDELSNLEAPSGPLPETTRDWLRDTLSLRIDRRDAEWSDGEIYLSLPRPGGDAWLSIDLIGGLVEYERTDRGWVSYLNDLHKGRNTGVAWAWFLDVFAVATLVFCLTGLLLLHLHARQRAATWPMVGLGLVAPLLLILLFIH